MDKTHLNCLYWNIHGISSKNLGDKNNDPHFLKIVSAFDVIGISELHSQKIVSIPGFYLKKQKFRPKKHKGPKIGGGIAVYVNQKVASNFRLIPSDNVDSIWIKTSLGSGDETNLGFYYCSPEKGDSNFFETVNSEIGKLNNGKNTYIFGDFNARTRTVCENIAHDKFDETLGIQTEMKSIPLSRNSEDMKIVNKRGKEFLDICRINDLSIANGRVVGDLFGKFTCHQKRGSSVVDYLISTHKAMRNITQFRVGEYLPLISDHCPIMATVRLDSGIRCDKGEEVQMQDLPDRYKWSDDSSKSFEDKLATNEYKEKVQKLLNKKDHVLIEEIKDLLMDVANASQVKKISNKRKSTKKDQPWFDKECHSIKKEISECGISLRMSPHDVSTREKIYFLKKKLRNLVKNNKMAFKTSIVNEMCSDLSKGQQKEYWKQLKKLEGSKDEHSYIPDYTLISHFKELLYDDKVKMECDQQNEKTGSLDHTITLDELRVASKILKAGKAPGIDNICNEMLKPLISTYPDLILRLLKDILTGHETLKKDWLHSLVTAIHKKGAKEDPDNYRGISLMSCLGKLFLTILRNRLTKYSLEKGLLSQGQLGFVQGNRTSDPHIILQNLLQKYCHKSNKKIFGCFVDFSKAFDSVPRDILLNKLKNKGINGRIFEIIKTLYLEDTASVKIGNRHSPPFKTNKGVRQGCVLSPLLFNLFLADLQPILDKCNNNVKLDEEKEISCLLWADDILIFSETEAGLQLKLKKLEEYCENNKLSVNTDKTKCMVFNKTGRLLKKHKFLYKDTVLDCVREYKYLGFLVTPSGEIRSGLQDLRNRAMRAFAKMKKSLGAHFRHDINNSIHLYNYMIKPILLYGSDFWGCLKQPKNNPIEKFHLMFCKQLLGVRKQTSTDGVLQELGMIPITLYAIKASVKNWERIQQSKANVLLVASFLNAIKEKLPWASNVRNLFSVNGMLQTYLSKVNNSEKNKNRSMANMIFQRLVDQFNQTSFGAINASSKLKTLSLLKDKPGTETYLAEVTNSKHRKAMTKLRLSAHSLEIETGRYSNTEREDRICSYCQTMGNRAIVEDEIHFLISCPMSMELRDRLLSPQILNNNLLNEKEKFVQTMTNSDIKATAKFIHQASENREVSLDVLSTIQDLTMTVGQSLIAPYDTITVSKTPPPCK